MKNRGMTEVDQELVTLIGDDHKTNVMVEALRWGLSTMRTTYALEARLFHDDDLKPLVMELTEYWDGQNFVSGALAAANRYIREKANGEVISGGQGNR